MSGSSAILSLYQDALYERYAHRVSSSCYQHQFFMLIHSPLSISGELIKCILGRESRYYGLASVIFDFYAIFSLSYGQEVGQHFPIWQGVTDIIINIAAQGILQLRIYALYMNNKLILRWMVALFVASWAASSVFIGLLLEEVHAQLFILPHDQFCAVTRRLQGGEAVWIPMFLFEVFLCALVVARGYHERKPLGPFSFHKGYKGLVGIIHRDSIIYFAGIGAIHMTCLLIWTIDKRHIGMVPLGYAIAIPCVLANRLVLNLRAAGRARMEIVMVDGITEEVAGVGETVATGPIVFAMGLDSS
ncbi:hypothetical protein CPC08DRAFT_708828 [Agrocybe pediades]|nr:hypothetical protein CPC08DRAFT_708828 [Agrocybe pediades]